MRNRYILMKESTQSDNNGNNYPDVLTFPEDRFVYTQTPLEVDMPQQYVDRLDILMSEYYGVPYYDDIIIWLNGVYSRNDIETGDRLYLPSKLDLNRFFVKNVV